MRSDNLDIEIIEPMTETEARSWKVEIETTSQKLGQLLYEGYKRDAWRVLGYGSWTQCVTDLAESSGFNRVRGFQLVEHERLKQDVLIAPNGEKPVTNVTEFQTRPLSKLKTDNEKLEVWQDAVKTAPNEKVTASHITNTVKEYQDTKKQSDTETLSTIPIVTQKDKDYFTLSEWNELSKDDQTSILTQDYQLKSKFNPTNDNIEWAKWSWNPITGCLHNCAYCYARDIAARFFPQNFEPTFLPSRLNAPGNTKLPDLTKISDPTEKMGQQNVFVCSMADLFGKWVPVEWINSVLESIRRNSQWNFLLLSKFPSRMADFSYPDNVWLGTSCDYQHTVKRAESAFIKIKESGFDGMCWLSCEPMMESLQFNSLNMFDWVVMGGASSSTKTPEFKPPFDWIVNLYSQARDSDCQLYFKTNLIPGMTDNQRIREYPFEIKVRHDS